MPDTAIRAFFEERKQAWLKKEVKASMDDAEVQQKHNEAEIKFSFEQWLPDAAKRAGQRAFSTHPSTFSHSSTGISDSNRKKYTYVTPLIHEGKYFADGYLKTGNVNTRLRLDALGNAAALDVDAFLSLKMEDGQTLLQHIEQKTELSKSLLTINSQSYDELRQGFLAMTTAATEQVTSSKIKQVYFPIPDETATDGYHQLSILTNSSIVFEMRRRLDAMRFGMDETLMNESDRKRYLTKEELKIAREKRRNNDYFEKPFDEIYGLTTIGYGGTKPQNISVLNNQNGGKAHLLLSAPPALAGRDFRFPTQDFFAQSISPYQVKPTFKVLHNIFKTHSAESVIPLKTLRAGRDNRLAELMDHIIENMWKARNAENEQYTDSTTKLMHWQKVWLLEEFSEVRHEQSEWLETVITEIRKWIISGYRKLVKEPCTIGECEVEFIEKFIAQYKEALR